MLTIGARLARCSGVTPQMISKAKKESKLIPVDGSKKYDTEHPINKAWLLSHGLDTKLEKLPEQPGVSMPEDVEGLAEEIRRMPFEDAVRRMGGPAEMKSFVDVLKGLLQAEERSIKNKKARGESIDRTFVKISVETYLRELHENLFDWITETVQDEVALATSADEPEKALKERREKGLERILEEARNKTKKVLHDRN